MRLEHHLVGGYVRYISPHIIIIIINNFTTVARESRRHGSKYVTILSNLLKLPCLLGKVNL